MAKSEIDDIFASKGKVNPSQPSSSSKTPENRDKVTKKSSKKKRKREAAQEVKDTNDAEEHERPLKRKVPETVVDPSISLSAPVKQKKSAAPEKREGAVKKPKKKGDKDDEERFKDSRGTGPSAFIFLSTSAYLDYDTSFRTEDRRRLPNIQRGRARHFWRRRR